MAAQKKSPVTSILGIGAVLLIAYVAYRFLFAKKVGAATSGYTGTYPSGGVYGTSGYSSQAGTAATTNPLSALGQMLAGLLGKSSSGGGSGSSAGSGSGATPIATKGAQTQQQLQQQMQAIAGYSSAANNASNPDLGGYSLLSLPPGFDGSGIDLSGYTIPNVPGPSLFDFGSNFYQPGVDLGGYISESYSNPIDTSSVDLSGITIDG